jgi:hypothetical protein
MPTKIAVILALSVATTAQAECYVRAAMSNQIASQVVSVTDIQPLVVPISPTQNKCIVNFRAQVNGSWITAEGEFAGPKTLSEDELCGQALNLGRSHILTQGGGLMNVEQSTVCTDQPIAKVRKVHIGETVRESEVLPHPNFSKPFNYRTSLCRWFIEPEVRPGDLLQRQGIICQLQGPEWKVVDKW